MEPKVSLLCSHKHIPSPYHEPDECSPTPSQPTSTRPNLILSSCLCLDFACDLSPSRFPIKILYVFLISPMHTTHHEQLILLNFITLIIFDEAPHYVVFSTLPQLPFRSKHSLLLFSHTLNLCSQPYKAKSKITVLYILIFKFLERRWEDKRF